MMRPTSTPRRCAALRSVQAPSCGAEWFAEGTRRATLAAAAVLALCLPGGAMQERKFPAPELEGGLGWLNTDKPVKMADLRGKIVLLDFWTYC